MRTGALFAICMVSVGCSSSLDTEGFDAGTDGVNNLQPEAEPNPEAEPEPEPKPEPEPEPNFTLTEGWYIADDVEFDARVTPPFVGVTLGATCLGVAAFNYNPQRSPQIEGIWECVWPNLAVDPIEGVVGEAFRLALGTYDPKFCTGELRNGDCHVIGEIRGAFDPDSGQVIGQITATAPEAGNLSNLFQTAKNVLFEIDQQEPFTGGYLSKTEVSFGYERSTSSTDFEYDLDANYEAFPPSWATP